MERSPPDRCDYGASADGGRARLDRDSESAPPSPRSQPRRWPLRRWRQRVGGRAPETRRQVWPHLIEIDTIMGTGALTFW